MTINDTETRKIRESDVATAEVEANSAEPKLDSPDAVAATVESTGANSTRRPLSISLSLRGLILGALIVALVVAVATLGWLYAGATHQIDAQAAQSANDAHAEKIALDYAVSAATMDFKDLQAWHVKLVAGTTPELTKKLSDAGTQMEQVLVPLQWSSSAKPLIAKVRSSQGGIYVVDSFVSVQTKTVQAPEALQSTATYSTTIDSHNNWLITDVGGIGSAMGPK
jgi:Mce-associated membrane protein